MLKGTLNMINEKKLIILFSNPQKEKKSDLCHSFLKSMPPAISPILSPYHSASSSLRYSDESLLRLLVGVRKGVD